MLAWALLGWMMERETLADRLHRIKLEVEEVKRQNLNFIKFDGMKSSTEK